jgi:biofilm PGA synthesis N-glycosyltransferase PgaC
MEFLKIFFWVSLIIIFYSYLGYGIILWVYLKLRSLFVKQPAFVNTEEYEPAVTLLVATYNEQNFIRKKIENTFELNYPSDKLRLLFTADGCTDNTVNIISEYPQIQLLFKPGREGKVAAINRAMPFVTTPFVIFCDDNTLLNKDCIGEIVKHYKDKNIGAVAGEKKIIDLSDKKNTAGSGEGLYWKYESFLKQLDARFYTVVGAAGELFSLRTELFEPVETNVLLDDFVISLRICQKGYRVMYEPKAFAAEAPSLTMKDEQKRKIRISAGGFQSVFMLKGLLNIFKYGKLSFQYISHRVLRWCICPFLLPLIFISNIFLWVHHAGFIYAILLVAQIFFYLAAAAGWVIALKNLKIKALYVPYYFVFMNASLYFGLARFITNKQTVLWEKANRKI